MNLLVVQILVLISECEFGKSLNPLCPDVLVWDMRMAQDLPWRGEVRIE